VSAKRPANSRRHLCRSFGPNALDGTFGPQLMYVKAPKNQGQNAARSERGQALGQTPEGLTPLLGDRPQVYPDKSRACEEKPPQFLASF